MAVDDMQKRKAWDLYAAQTRRLQGSRYEEVEPFAWAQLQSKLGNLKPRRVTSGKKAG